MNRHSLGKTPEQMVEAIFALDLDPIKFKLMDKKEGLGWTRAEADCQELEYRRFLALLAKYPDAAIVPNTVVDRFWHAHILDTMKYAEDCHHIFGHFVHHFPYFGMRDAEDASNLAVAATETRRLYVQEFGDASVQDAAYCGRVAAGTEQDSAYCGRVAAGMEQNAAYCGRVAVSAEQDAAYCGRVAADTKQNAAYCGRVAGTAEQSATSVDAAYCGSANPAYYATVLGKGRPTLEPACSA
jgi:hypothetical protein